MSTFEDLSNGAELDEDFKADLLPKKPPEVRLFQSIILRAWLDIEDYPEDVLTYVNTEDFGIHCDCAGFNRKVYKERFLKRLGQ